MVMPALVGSVHAENAQIQPRKFHLIHFVQRILIAALDGV
jgi:hypothetical protein